jgi:tungstate transport system substrate-binding protein
MKRLARALIACLALLAASLALAEQHYIVLASTTSTESSGLFGHLIPRFRAATGIDVRVVAVGTGQAFAIARNGDADALLVHDTAGEEAFVRDGFGLERRDVMYNDYLIVGPAADPAGVRDADDAAEAFSRIASGRLPFVSRGDDSGTHRAELRIWQRVGIAARGSWYRELGSGMGSTLNTAAAMDAYVLADRGSWISFRNRQDLELLFAGDPALFNQYGSVLIHPGRHPHLRHALARQWHGWLLGGEGQAAIAEFRVHDQQVFFPNARQGPELQPDRAMRTVVAGRRSNRPGTE